MISTFVVEDESKILEVTLAMLATLDVEVLGSASTIDDAYREIIKLRPDVVLLDVEVGKSTSFELLERFDSIEFKVIFITAHQKYALDAFKFSAIDFILKPISLSALKSSLARVDSVANNQSAIKTLQDNLKSSPEEQKLILKTQEKIHILRLGEIMHCTSDLSYTTFYTTNETIIVSKTIGYYDELLSKYGFFRVHKSHLINLAHVHQIHKSEGTEVELTDGSRIPVSQRKKEDFLSLIDGQGLV